MTAALDALAELTCDPAGVRRSSLWASRPLDCPPGSPDFVNAALALPVAPTLEPEALLDDLQRLELDAGRRRGVRNAPRTLDLDLLLLGDCLRDTARLVLPHPRGHERAFVLVPAAEVAAELIWPGSGRRIGDLAAKAPGREDLKRLS